MVVIQLTNFLAQLPRFSMFVLVCMPSFNVYLTFGAFDHGDFDQPGF